MTVQQLRFFTTVAQLENMSRAAQLLQISQSSLSKNIAKLEEEIGTSLFRRNGKAIELNPAGEAFLACCNQLLRNLDTAVREIRLNSSGSDGRIRIGSCGPNAMIIRCISEFRAENPGVEFDMNCSIDSLEHVDINDFDAMIYEEGLRYEKFSGFRLGTEKYFLAVSSAHPLAAAGTVTSRKLNDLDMVFLRQGKERMEPMYELCMALALHFASQSIVDSREFHRQLIASGVAAGFVPEGEAESYSADRRIVLLPVMDQRFSRELMICFRREKHLTDCSRAFRDHCIRSLGLDHRH